MPAERHYTYRFQVHDNTKVKLLLPNADYKEMLLYTSAAEAGICFLQVQQLLPKK